MRCRPYAIIYVLLWVSAVNLLYLLGEFLKIPCVLAVPSLLAASSYGTSCPKLNSVWINWNMNGRLIVSSSIA